MDEGVKDDTRGENLQKMGMTPPMWRYKNNFPYQDK